LRLRLALLFAVFALLYTGPALLPGRVLLPVDLPRDYLAWKHDRAVRVRVSNSLLSDAVVQNEVWDAEARRLLASGELPWVNRFAGDGEPLFANPLAALLSPFTWPRLLFGVYGWVLCAIAKLVAAALCAYWLARELGAEREPAIVSGLVFAGCGPMIVWLLFPHTNTLALLPGFAAACLRLMRQAEERNALLVIALAALATVGGHPEGLLVGVVATFALLMWEGERTHRWGLFGAVPPMTGALFGFAMLGIVLVPFAFLMTASEAAAMRPSLPHPFRAWSLVSQLVPGILGSPLRGELDLTALPRAESFSIRVGGYVGALVLLAIVVAWRELTPLQRRAMKIACVGLVLSWAIPGVAGLMRLVPLVRFVSFEYCALAFAIFASAVAGPALYAIASRPRRKLGLLLAIAGALVLAIGIAPALPPMRPLLTRIAHAAIASLQARGHLQQPSTVYEQRLAYYLGAASLTALRRIALPGALWLLAGVALWWSDRRPRLSTVASTGQTPVAPLRGRIVALAAVAELAAFGIGFNPSVPLRDAAPLPGPVAAIQRLDPQHRWLIAAHFETFPANLGTLYAVRDVVAYDILTPQPRIEQLRAAGYDSLLHTIPRQLSPAWAAALARLGVCYVISVDPVPGAHEVARDVWELPHPAPAPLPRNDAPRGLLIGAIVSLLAIVTSFGWLRLYRGVSDERHPELAR
jgi:hypothetical protein